MLPKNAKILIADDMPTIRDLVTTQLRSMGYENILEAQDGEQALSLLIRHSNSADKIQMIISDWNMPKIKGIDFLKQVRGMDQWADLPFILLTSESERDQVTDAVLSGVSQYIVKPFIGRTLEEKRACRVRKCH